MEYIEMGARRDAHSVEDVIKRTLTVGELIEILEEYDYSTPVILSHDGGYTYGALHEGRITLEETDVELDEDYEEEEIKADDEFEESLQEYDHCCGDDDHEDEDDDDLDEDYLHCEDDCDDDFGDHRNSYDVDEAHSFKGLNDIFGGKTLAESLRPRTIRRK